MHHVVCVGSNYFGQLGIGSTPRRKPAYCPVAMGSTPEEQALVEQSMDLQCGSNFTAVLDSTGQVYLCGSMNGTIHPTLTRAHMSYPLKFTMIACGRKHIIALAENGSVLSWGTGHFGQLGHGTDTDCNAPKIIASLEQRRIGCRPIRVACGGSHSGVVTNTGMVFMWGLNRSGQTGTDSKLDSLMDPLPIDTSDVLGGGLMATELVCGRNHSSALTADGRLFSWGAGTFGRLGITDGRKKVVRPIEVTFFHSRPVASLAVGDFHSIALCRNGELYSWGHNLEGQCGIGTAVNVKSPKKIDFFGPEIRIKEVCCGSSWSVAISTTGRCYVWGHGDGGWLCVPSPVPPLLDEETLNRVIPYIDSTPEDPCPESGLMHTRSFDSCHNIMLPCPIRIPCDSSGPRSDGARVEEAVVDKVRCGGSLMVLYLSRSRRRWGGSSKSGSILPLIHAAGKIVDSRSEYKSGVTTLLTRSSTETLTVELTGSETDVDEEDKYLRVSLIKSGVWHFSSSSVVSPEPLTERVDSAPRASSADLDPSASRARTAPGIQTMDNEQLQSVLFSWCRHNKVPELTYAIINRGIGVNARDNAGNTPLIVACQNGHHALCQMLVEHAGADLNLKNLKGNTALHFCFAYGFHSLGEYLISKGADEFATNVDGLTCYEGLSAADLEKL